MPKFVNQVAADKWAHITYGCSIEEAERINGEPLVNAGSFAQRYRAQKRAAAKRGIEWQFSFGEWVRLWVESGRWHQRGRGKIGYCMARAGDIGPYSAANVSIQTCAQNSRDGIKVAFPAMLESLRKAPRFGAGCGWTLRTGTRFKNPYQVMVGKKYIGCFATEAEAESAYLAAAQKIRHVRNSKEVS